jgi:hypothetical protein
LNRCHKKKEIFETTELYIAKKKLKKTLKKLFQNFKTEKTVKIHKTIWIEILLSQLSFHHKSLPTSSQQQKAKRAEEIRNEQIT